MTVATKSRAYWQKLAESSQGVLLLTLRQFLLGKTRRSLKAESTCFLRNRNVRPLARNLRTAVQLLHLVATFAERKAMGVDKDLARNLHCSRQECIARWFHATTRRPIRREISNKNSREGKRDPFECKLLTRRTRLRPARNSLNDTQFARDARL